MEVALVNKNTIRLKGKNANLLVDPDQQIPKTTTDAVIFLSNYSDSKERLLKVSDQRVVIKGSGSYEVGGIRMISQNYGDVYFYSIVIDNINLFLGQTRDIEKQQEKGAVDMLLLNANEDLKESMIGSFEPKILVLYGEKAEAAAKLLGKDFTTATKFSQSADKFPADMQVVLLR